MPTTSCTAFGKRFVHLHATSALQLELAPNKIYFGGCTVKKGDRVAQLILEQILTPEVEEVAELDSTERGSGGYGSTGVAN